MKAIERFFDKFDHTMSFIRTIIPLVVLGVQLIILDKLS